MDSFELAASLTGSLAWPLVAVIVIIILRSELRTMFVHLAERMKDLKSITGPGDITAEFEDSVLDAKQEVDSIQAGSEISLEEKDVDSAASEDALGNWYAKAETSPRAVIIESWVLLEQAIRNLYVRLYGGNPNRFGMAPVIRRIRDETPSDVVRNAMDIALDFSRLRNTAVHEPDFNITSLAAFEYANTAQRVTRIVDKAVSEYGETSTPSDLK